MRACFDRKEKKSSTLLNILYLFTITAGTCVNLHAQTESVKQSLAVHWSGSSVFSVSVKASIQEADPLLQVVSLLSHHSVSHHPLFPNQPLQFITFEALKPAGGDDEVSRMCLEIP